MNGLLAPVMLWFIVRLADCKDVVGAHVSTPLVRTLGWLCFLLMAIAALVLVITVAFIR
jgi:Mn2+/Fe2+ NRAMP family transporter